MAEVYRGGTAGNMAVRSGGPGDHVACDAAVAGLRVRAETRADDELARIVHETRREFGAAFERPMTPAPWEERHPRQQELDRQIAAAVVAAAVEAVEAVVRERIGAELRCLAHDAAAEHSTVPGIERRTRRDTYLAAAQVVLHGCQDRGDAKEPQP